MKKNKNERKREQTMADVLCQLCEIAYQKPTGYMAYGIYYSYRLDF